MKKSNLNKPILYVIENINFDKHVLIFGYNNCEVIIKNCNFEYGAYVWINGKCTIEDSSIKEFLSYLSIGADDLTIKNINLKNFGSNVGFYADNVINIIDSNIGSKKEKTNISIMAVNGINLANSKIEGSKINCKTKYIESDKNSTLIATDNLDLNRDNFNQLNIESPFITYNGKSLINNRRKIVLYKNDSPLRMKRLEFLEVLKKLKNKCALLNNRKIEETKKELDNQAIVKILKKDN